MKEQIQSGSNSNRGAGMLVRRAALLFLSWNITYVGSQFTDPYPSSAFRPTTATLTADSNRAPFFADISLEFQSELSSNVDQYDVRFGVTATDLSGVRIELVANTAVADTLTVSYTGETRSSTVVDGNVVYLSDPPVFINIFILNSNGAANPVPFSILFEDFATPLVTPLVSGNLHGFVFEDTDPARNSFAAELRLNIDSALMLVDTDGTLATITSFKLLDHTETELASVPYAAASSVFSITASVSFSLPELGGNLIYVCAANEFGCGPLQQQVLTDLVPIQLELVDPVTDTYRQMAEETISSLTPEKLDFFLLNNGLLILNYGDFIELDIPNFTAHTQYILTGENLIVDGNFELSVTMNGGDEWLFSVDAGAGASGSFTIDLASGRTGKGLAITTTSVTSQALHIQATTTSWAGVSGRNYVIKFWTRSSVAGNTVTLALSFVNSPFTTFQSSTFTTRTDWTFHSVDVTEAWASAQDLQFSFQLGDSGAAVYFFDDVEILESEALGVGSEMDFTATFYRNNHAISGFSDVSLDTSFGPTFVSFVLGGGYKIEISGFQNSSDSGPEQTEVFTTDTITVIVQLTPTPPNTGVPINLAFVDTDPLVSRIGGLLTWEESTDTTYRALQSYRQFDYFLIYLTNDPNPFLPNLNPLAVVKWTAENAASGHSFVIPDGTVQQDFIHIATLETTNRGAGSTTFATLPISGVAVDSSLPVVQAVSFKDGNGTTAFIKGPVTVTLPADVSNVLSVVVHLASSRNFASRQTRVGTYTLQGEVGGSDVTVDIAESFSLNPTTDNFLGFLHVYILSPSGSISLPLAVAITDRSDEYFFVENLIEQMGVEGEHGVLYYPSIDPGYNATTNFYIDGHVTIGWTVPDITNTVFPVSEGGDDLAIDVSNIFEYDVELGDLGCSVSNALSAPTTVPQGGIQASDCSTISGSGLTLLNVTVTYSELAACGFIPEGAGLLTLVGTSRLLLRTIDARTDTSGSTLDSSAQQVAFETELVVRFADTTHAAISGLSINRVVRLDELSEQIPASSVLRLYRPGFNGEVPDGTVVTFEANRDTLYFEHGLTVNTDLFDLTLDTIYFSPDAYGTSIEYSLPPGDTAFTNVDVPAVAGRVRGRSLVRPVMNCRPCFLHVQSSLSLRSKKKSGEEERATIRATHSIAINIAVADTKEGIDNQ